MPDTLIVRGTTRLPPLGAPVVATIGNFDGVHLGHQRLLGRVRGIKGCWAAEGSSPSAVAISFHPHPSVVLGRAKKMPLISSLRQRLAILSSFEIDIFYMLHFTKQFARVRAADFVERVLFGELNVQHLVVGPDATVGYRREGDVHFLARAFAAAGRSFETIPPLMIEDLRVSSEHIRSLLREGRVEEAARLLGRSFVRAGVPHGEAEAQRAAPAGRRRIRDAHPALRRAIRLRYERGAAPDVRGHGPAGRNAPARLRRRRFLQ